MAALEYGLYGITCCSNPSLSQAKPSLLPSFKYPGISKLEIVQYLLDHSLRQSRSRPILLFTLASCPIILDLPNGFLKIVTSLRMPYRIIKTISFI